jgi:hypothetical protein
VRVLVTVTALFKFTVCSLQFAVILIQVKKQNTNEHPKYSKEHI